MKNRQAKIRPPPVILVICKQYKSNKYHTEIVYEKKWPGSSDNVQRFLRCL